MSYFNCLEALCAGAAAEEEVHQVRKRGIETGNKKILWTHFYYNNVFKYAMHIILDRDMFISYALWNVNARQRPSLHVDLHCTLRDALFGGAPSLWRFDLA